MKELLDFVTDVNSIPEKTLRAKVKFGVNGSKVGPRSKKKVTANPKIYGLCVQPDRARHLAKF